VQSFLPLELGFRFCWKQWYMVNTLSCCAI